MVCACSLLFNAAYYTLVLGFPLYNLYLLDKKQRIDIKWIYYFLILSLFNILENTLLYPMKYLLEKICLCMFPALKAGFAFWLYSPKLDGISYIDSKLEPYIIKAFEKINPQVGGFLAKLGLPIYSTPAPTPSSFTPNKKTE